MEEIVVEWQGEVVGVNDWHGARAFFDRHVKKGPPRTRALIFEKATYRKFKRELAKALAGHKADRGLVDVSIYLEVRFGRDTDGPIKPIIDALQFAKVINNDNLVRHIFTWRGYHVDGLPDRVAYRITHVDELMLTRRH